MRRVLAVVAAIGMLAGAVYVRGRIDRKAEDKANPLRLTCSTELESVCLALVGLEGVRTTVEPAGTTADRLIATDTTSAAAGTIADLGLDAWLVAAPWPAIVDEARDRKGLTATLDGAGTTVGRSPLIVMASAERAGVLNTRCGTITLKCIGDAAAGTWRQIGGAEIWGHVKPQHANPAREASGLAVVGAGAIEVVGRGDVSRDDLDAEPFVTWFTNLERALVNPEATGAAGVQLMLTRGTAAVDIVMASEAEIGPLYFTSARKNELSLIYPSPVATLDAVIVGQQASEQGQRLVDLVTGDTALSALAEGGWRVQGKPVADGVRAQPALPLTNGLPSAGVLDAIRTRFQEVTR